MMSARIESLRNHEPVPMPMKPQKAMVRATSPRPTVKPSDRNSEHCTKEATCQALTLSTRRLSRYHKGQEHKPISMSIASENPVTAPELHCTQEVIDEWTFNA